METVAKLIARSVSHNEIVSTEHTPDLEVELLLACEGSVEADYADEFWGETDDGEEWRVHLLRLPCWIGEGASV